MWMLPLVSVSIARLIYRTAPGPRSRHRVTRRIEKAQEITFVLLGAPFTSVYTY